MPGWVLLASVVLGWLLLMIWFGMSARKERKLYLREIAKWAQTRKLAFREGGGNHAWKAPLPRGGDIWFQVDGARSGHAFTIVYALEVHAVGAYVEVETTVVVVYLPVAYPAVAIQPRSIFRRNSTTGTIGHAAFDRKFRVRTRAPGGPASVISTRLAEAHLNGNVPLWTLRDKELMCHSAGKPKVEDLDATLNRALRVAELLTL